ncbi:MAG: hypothetical protein B7Z15_23320, partial [Rhizobiales bacterium 32-66-8]
MTYGTLTDAEARDLRALAGIMIPASSAHGVPGADDALIFADVLKSLERDTADAQIALKHLRELSGGAFAELAPERRTEVAMRFRHEGGAPLFALNRVVLLCYYRDDRVMREYPDEVIDGARIMA